jgi:hypothetical protein
MKIYLCGITQNDYQNIDELTSIYEYFDGLIFVDGGSNDGTKELLESRKKDGAIIYRKWTNDHDYQMNEFLRQGPMKIGDWFLLRDSRERFNPQWVKNIKEMINQFSKNQIRSVYNYGKGFAFEYYDDMYFSGSPHWGLFNARGNSLELSNYFDENKKEHTWRLKDGDGGRSEANFIDHFVKYYFVYGRSNHLLLGRENDREAFVQAETNRQNFRLYCASLGIDFTINALKEYLMTDTWKKDIKFLTMFNNEEILRNFYRWHILKDDIEKIKTESKTWRLNV